MYFAPLATTSNCCSNKVTVQGPTGSPGLGPIGPVGYTGISGIGLTGPTGQGCTGPTGPAAPFSGITGSTGPTGSTVTLSSMVTPLSFISGQPLVLPIPSAPISYYSVVLTDSIGVSQINATNLPSGYQAIIFVTVTVNSQIQVTVNGAYNLYSNINTPSSVFINVNNSATVTILSNGSGYFANIVLTQT